MIIKNKSVVVLALIFTIAVFFSCCDASAPQQVSESESMISSEENVPEEPEEEGILSPYISITYGMDNPDNFTGRDMVFYTYDLVTKELKEECVIPFDSDYASGVVSKINNTLYYSARAETENLSSNDCLWAYDIATGKSEILESENMSYNEMTLVDSETILVLAGTRQHSLMPALFDLKTNTFSYISDVNNEDFSLYSNGSAPLIYNYNLSSFVSIYQNEKESCSSEYHNFETEINTYIAVVQKSLVKAEDKIYTASMLNWHWMQAAAQISENKILVQKIDYSVDPVTDGLVNEYSFYYLVFKEDGEATFTPTKAPFPCKSGVNGFCTVDEGKIWYLQLYADDYNDGGLYTYDTETEELTPILLNNSETNGHVVNFSIIGPPEIEK